MTGMRAVAWSLVLFGLALEALSLVLGVVVGIVLGFGCFALGVIVLAVRRPEPRRRREDDAPDVSEVPEFKWRKP